MLFLSKNQKALLKDKKECIGLISLQVVIYIFRNRFIKIKESSSKRSYYKITSPFTVFLTSSI